LPTISPSEAYRLTGEVITLGSGRPSIMIQIIWMSGIGASRMPGEVANPVVKVFHEVADDFVPLIEEYRVREAYGRVT